MSPETFANINYTQIHLLKVAGKLNFDKLPSVSNVYIIIYFGYDTLDYQKQNETG